jgi:3-phosphoglycerate kinase
MPFRSIKDLDVKGHRVFLRADLNVPIRGGVVRDAMRIRETLPTLQFLLEKGASVVLASHLGRPKGEGTEPPYSLAPVTEWLKAEGFDIRMASGVIGEKVEAEAAALKPGQILMLENLRYHKGEVRNREDFALSLAKLADTYVNDAFGTAHRLHASVSGMVAFFDSDRIAAGFLLTKELKAMGRITNNPERPLVAVIGGAKVSEKIGLIRHFLGKAQTILIGGAMSFTFLKAQGIPVGNSLYEDDKLDLARDLLVEARDKGTILRLPIDHVVAEEITPGAETSVIHGQAVPEGKMGLDIGPDTIALYTLEIQKAKTLLWNGPMGVFEMEPFSQGTLTVAEEMANAADKGAYVLLGGGDSISAANKAGVAARISHLSTGGGASLEFLSGLRLPGVTALTVLPFRTLRDLDLKGHRVFLRADLNAPVKDSVVKDATRIRETLPTLQYLLDHGASVVLASHLGRPSGIGFEAEYSLAPVATWLKGQGFDVTLAGGVVGERVLKLANALEPGQVLLLENLRFDKGETRNREDFCKALARMADTYVDDAFGAAHRAHASVSGMVPYFEPERIAAGFLLEKELKAMRRVMVNPVKPLVAVLGGAKVTEKIELISHFLGRADTILIGGAMSYTFLKAQGIPVGNSLYEDDKLELALKLMQEAKSKGTELMLPVDHVIASEISPRAECAITSEQAIPEGRMGLDIGPATVTKYVQELRSASTILWNGPMGVFEMEPFAAGTLAMAEEMAVAADRGAFVLLGGGDSISAANKAGVAPRMSHMSTGGGASLEYLSGLELPGVAALHTQY